MNICNQVCFYFGQTLRVPRPLRLTLEDVEIRAHRHIVGADGIFAGTDEVNATDRLTDEERQIVVQFLNVVLPRMEADP